MTLILGLESSCDETAAAVVADGVRVLSNVVASQHDLHERYRGVVPEIASRAHLERLWPTVESAVREAGVELNQIDGVAVGNCPGLIGSLVVGVSAAAALAWAMGRPLIGVDHVQAHLWAPRLAMPDSAGAARPHEPVRSRKRLGLVVSGGHTSLYEVASPLDLRLLGRTIDDAVGEAFDKAATILGLGYPGGPAIDRLAPEGDPRAVDLPRSMLGPESLDFSFSGLKTALLYAVRGHPRGRGGEATFERSAEGLTHGQRADFAASFQAAAVDAVVRKLERAMDRSEAVEGGEGVGELLLGGGRDRQQRAAAAGAGTGRAAGRGGAAASDGVLPG